MIRLQANRTLTAATAARRSRGTVQGRVPTALNRNEPPLATYYYTNRAGARGSSRWSSTEAITAEENVPTPSSTQLRNHFMKSAVPMIGFGFMDQTVMLQAGNAIDCTLGVTFGLSTLTAAAFGQVCSDAAGVLFGGTLESIGRAMGLPKSGLTTPQRSMQIVKRVGLAGQLVGVIIGCVLGLANLLLIDTERSSTLKLQALSDEQEFAFEVEASNALREDATVLTVRGPDVDGLLASMTAALTAKGCSLMELHAAKAAAVIPPQQVSANLKNKDNHNNDNDNDNSNDSKSDKSRQEKTKQRQEVSLSTTIGSPSTPASNISTNTLDFGSIKGEDTSNNVEDTFVVVRQNKQVPDDELDELASALLEATFHPINVRSFKAHAQQLEQHNEELQNRVQKLERLLQERQIRVVPRSKQVMATSTKNSNDLTEESDNNNGNDGGNEQKNDREGGKNNWFFSRK